MSRTKAKDLPPSLLSWRVHIAKDPKGVLHISGYSDNGSIRWVTEGKVLEEIAIVETGRPLRYHVPPAGEGLRGIVFEDMTGGNAEPWSAHQILAAARFGMFGFRLVS